MHAIPSHLHPAAAKSLARWHTMVAANDLRELGEIVHPDAVFRSPVAFNAYRPAQALILALNTVTTVFEDFAYDRQLASDDGLSAVLEFGARVGELRVKGIDFIRFDAEGKIREFEVMLRPLNGLQALANIMGARLGDRMPSFKLESNADSLKVGAGGTDGSDELAPIQV